MSDGDAYLKLTAAADAMTAAKRVWDELNAKYERIAAELGDTQDRIDGMRETVHRLRVAYLEAVNAWAESRSMPKIASDVTMLARRMP